MSMSDETAGNKHSGMLVRSGKPGKTTVERSEVPGFEVIEWGCAPRKGYLSFYLLVAVGFFARLALGWHAFKTGGVFCRVHPLVGLDLSRRLVQAAARGELGEKDEE